VRATAPGLLAAFLVAFLSAAPGAFAATAEKAAEPAATPDYWSLVFVFVLSTFIGIGAIARVSRLLHTPLMSLTNAISAIAVVGSILVTGGDHPPVIRVLGAIALFASTTNIVSGFMITDRMLKMFRRPDVAAAKPGGTQPNGAKP
jgi:NAD(P) transhydrogenase subunit alpha